MVNQKKRRRLQPQKLWVLCWMDWNGKCKCPIAYFLQSKSYAIIQFGLVTTTITMQKMLMFKFWGITCDGASINISTVTHILCVHGSYDELVQYFIIPGIDWMVKLLILSIKLCVVTRLISVRVVIIICMYARRGLLSTHLLLIVSYL